MKRHLDRVLLKASPIIRVIDRPIFYWVLTALVFALSVFFFARYSAYPFDDAFIHMRIARNISEFGRPYFNVNEAVMGSSPHLWINGLALIFFIFGPNAELVPYYSFLWFMVGAFLFARVLMNEGIKKPQAFLLSLSVLSIYSLYSVSGQMETALVTTLLGAAILAVQTRDGFWGGFFSTLVIWGRYEFVFVSIFAFLLSKKKKEFVVGGAIPVALFLIYCFAYFGTFVPQPVKAKPIVYLGAGQTNYSFFTKPFLISKFVTGGTARIVDAVLVMGSVLALALFGSKRTAERLLLMLGATITLIYVFQKPMMFPWYLPNVFVPLSLGLLLIGMRSFRSREFWKTAAVLVLSYNVLSSPFTWFKKSTYGAVTGELQRNVLNLSNFRVQDYFEIGKNLSALSSDKVLLASEIGGLGWSYPGPICDGIALVSPAALKHHPLKLKADGSRFEPGSIPLAYLKEVMPQWVVSMPTFMEEIAPFLDDPKGPYKLLQEVPIFSSAKVPANTRLPTEFWGAKSVKVYERKLH